MVYKYPCIGFMILAGWVASLGSGVCGGSEDMVFEGVVRVAPRVCVILMGLREGFLLALRLGIWWGNEEDGRNGEFGRLAAWWKGNVKAGMGCGSWMVGIFRDSLCFEGWKGGAGAGRG